MSDPMEAVLQYVDACNIGDPVAMAATCADTMQILDGMSPCLARAISRQGLVEGRAQRE
jgi:hypothetical protein